MPRKTPNQLLRELCNRLEKISLDDNEAMALVAESYATLAFLEYPKETEELQKAFE